MQQLHYESTFGEQAVRSKALKPKRWQHHTDKPKQLTVLYFNVWRDA
jgi:hypothetical protein